MASDELKPCPFCGGKAVLLPRTCERHMPYRERDRAFPVACCGDCFVQMGGKDWSDVKTAAEAWNNRAQDFDAMRQRADAADRLLASVISQFKFDQEIRGGIPVRWEDLINESDAFLAGKQVKP